MGPAPSLARSGPALHRLLFNTCRAPKCHFMADGQTGRVRLTYLVIDTPAVRDLSGMAFEQGYLPVPATSHNCIIPTRSPSSGVPPPEAKVRPSGENETE